MNHSHRKSLASVPGYRWRRAWRRIGARVHAGSMFLMYALFGLAGVLLWGLMHLPMSARWKEAVVFAMAGCLGLFAAGWQMMRSSVASPTR